MAWEVRSASRLDGYLRAAKVTRATVLEQFGRFEDAFAELSLAYRVAPRDVENIIAQVAAKMPLFSEAALGMALWGLVGIVRKAGSEKCGNKDSNLHTLLVPAIAKKLETDFSSAKKISWQTAGHLDYFARQCSAEDIGFTEEFQAKLGAAISKRKKKENDKLLWQMNGNK